MEGIGEGGEGAREQEKGRETDNVGSQMIHISSHPEEMHFICCNPVYKHKIAFSKPSLNQSCNV